MISLVVSVTIDIVFIVKILSLVVIFTNNIVSKVNINQRYAISLLLSVKYIGARIA
jgi:hypothetical protein